MFSLSLDDAARAMHAKIICTGKAQAFRTVATDSRKVREGDLFFALKGPNFDGHDFAAAASGKGASGVVLERPVAGIAPGTAVLDVSSASKALQDLAAYNRGLARIPVIGVTGSSGKTSTRDLLHAVLSVKLKTLKTEGNLNNELGLPLTLLALDETHQAAVVEMAMRGPGEIDLLAGIARPSAAVIANIGEAHLERLGSVDRIARAKGEILDHITREGFAVLHGDSPFIHREARRCRGKVIYYGEKEEYDLYLEKYRPSEEGTGFSAVIRGKTEEFYIPLPGRHNAVNSLAAIAVGLELDLGIGEIRSGLAKASLSAMRLEICDWRGARIINDCYNANPSSTGAALRVLADIAGTRSGKIAVLGDMLELGQESEAIHRNTGGEVYSSGVHLLAAVGDLAVYIGRGAIAAGMPANAVRFYSSAAEAARDLRDIVRPGDVVLVKGSRGMHMEDFFRLLNLEKK